MWTSIKVFFASIFRHRCASCQAKSEQIVYLQKLIDQLLVKNGLQGLREAPQRQETAEERRIREKEQKMDDELRELVADGGQIFGGDD